MPGLSVDGLELLVMFHALFPATLESDIGEVHDVLLSKKIPSADFNEVKPKEGCCLSARNPLPLVDTVLLVPLSRGSQF